MTLEDRIYTAYLLGAIISSIILFIVYYVFFKDLKNKKRGKQK